jgi:hypothetical protein
MAGAEVAMVVAVVVSTGEASAVELSTAVVVSVGDVSAVAVSSAVAFVVAVLVASAFPGGAGDIHTDITVTTITRTITMDTADTHTAPMDTADTVTMVGPVTDTAMTADQGMSGVRAVGDKPRLRVSEIASLLVPVDNNADYVDPSDVACAMSIVTSPPRA